LNPQLHTLNTYTVNLFNMVGFIQKLANFIYDVQERYRHNFSMQI